MSVQVNITFNNLRTGFVSAWDAAREDYGEGFALLPRDDQIAIVQRYVSTPEGIDPHSYDPLNGHGR